jgi:hypothetical protein
LDLSGSQNLKCLWECDLHTQVQNNHYIFSWYMLFFSLISNNWWKYILLKKDLSKW